MENPAGGPGVEPPEEFTELVRDALIHLYDPAHLQTHPLQAYLSGGAPPLASRDKRLRKALLDAIESLRPAAQRETAGSAWRAYRILELRYVEGNEVSEVIAQIALSKSQYHREHSRALTAVASLLWETWQVASEWPVNPARIGIAPRPAAASPTDELLAAEVSVAPSSSVDPVEILRGVSQLLEPLSKRQGVRLQLSLPADSVSIRGERVMLRQLLLLVLSYALETARGETVTVELRPSPPTIALDVSYLTAEPGQIPTAEIAKWHPFLDALGGEIATDLPADRLTPGVIRLTFSAGISSLLLVVDNSRDFISLIERYLRGYPWDVVGVATVDEALALARDRQPAAILLDIVIPGRDGWDLLVELKTSPTTRDIPVIVCSILGKPEIATLLGAARYLQKPISQEALLRALAEVRSSAPARG